MARLLDEFFTPKALSRTAFLKKFPKGPFVAKITAVDFQEVKKGGDQQFALELSPHGVWISCGKENSERLAAKFGRDVDLWIGKKIKLQENPEAYQGKKGFLLIPN